MAELPSLLEGSLQKQGNAALKLFHPRFVVLKEDGAVYSFKKASEAKIWKGAKLLLRLERKRGSIGRVTGSPLDFTVSRAGKTQCFRADNPDQLREWVSKLQSIVDPVDSPASATSTPRHHKGGGASKDGDGPDLERTGSDEILLVDPSLNNVRSSTDSTKLQDDSYQTASELSNAKVDTTGLFDIHFPQRPPGNSFPPLRQRNIDLSVSLRY